MKVQNMNDMLKRPVLMCVWALGLWMLCGCGEIRPSGEVLKISSSAYSFRDSVSIPLLRINAVSVQDGKKKDLVLSAQVISKWPDKLRLKIEKARYHLLSMVVNRHTASLYFPRTDKIYSTELNRPVLDGKTGGNLLPVIIEMSLMFIRGPFPQYSLSVYTEQKKENDIYIYTADLPEFTLELSIHALSYRVLRQVYRFKGDEKWVMDISFDRYMYTDGNIPYPRKILMEVFRDGEPADKTLLEMYVSRVSFGRSVSEKAFKADWPEDAVEIKTIPDKPEDLFGKLEDENDNG